MSVVEGVLSAFWYSVQKFLKLERARFFIRSNKQNSHLTNNISNIYLDGYKKIMKWTRFSINYVLMDLAELWWSEEFTFLRHISIEIIHFVFSKHINIYFDVSDKKIMKFFSLLLCLSGVKSFDFCWNEGLCYGKHLQVLPQIFDYDKCLDLCKATQNCFWSSFDEDNSLCHLNGACYQVLKTDTQSSYRYAKRDCPLKGNKILRTNYFWYRNIQHSDLLRLKAKSEWMKLCSKNGLK